MTFKGSQTFPTPFQKFETPFGTLSYRVPPMHDHKKRQLSEPVKIINTELKSILKAIMPTAETSKMENVKKMKKSPGSGNFKHFF